MPEHVVFESFVLITLNADYEANITNTLILNPDSFLCLLSENVFSAALLQKNRLRRTYANACKELL